MVAPFGSFEPLCSRMPLAWCNLFMRQLAIHSPDVLHAPSTPLVAAPVGVNPSCGITRLSQPNAIGGGKSLGNIANIVACGLSFFVVLYLVARASRRRAAVGRVEFRFFLMMYLLSLPFNLLTTGGIFEQGGKVIAILTAVHAGIVAALFWTLLGNAIIATQVVEDGTPSALIPFYTLTFLFFVATLYISLDVALTITKTFGPSSPPEQLQSIPVFVLTQIWPAAAIFFYFIIMMYVVLSLLREVRPVWNFVLSLVLFVLSQLAFYLLSETICNGSSAKIDGSFVATILETASVFVLFMAWRSITEESWGEEDYYRNSVGL